MDLHNFCVRSSSAERIANFFLAHSHACKYYIACLQNVRMTMLEPPGEEEEEVQVQDEDHGDLRLGKQVYCNIAYRIKSYHCSHLHSKI